MDPRQCQGLPGGEEGGPLELGVEGVLQGQAG